VQVVDLPNAYCKRISCEALILFKIVLVVVSNPGVINKKGRALSSAALIFNRSRYTR